MKFIEFVGPPGSGKSALQSALVSEDRFSGDFKGEMTNRLVSEEYGKYFGRLLEISPDYFKKRFQHLMNLHLTQDYTYDMMCSNSLFMKKVMGEIQFASYNHGKLFHDLERSIHRYCLGMDVLNDDEILCVDEGFYFNAVLISLYKDMHSVPSTDFFKTIPNPDIVIHLDVPPELCLSRQERRNRVVVTQDKEWIKDRYSKLEAQNIFNHYCEKVARLAEDYGSKMIVVDNSAELNTAVDEVRNEIFNTYKNSSG